MGHLVDGLKRKCDAFCRLPAAAWFAVLFVLLTVLYVAMIPIPRADNHLLGSDGGYYYSYMRSFWLDHDVNIQNDVALYNSRMTPDNSNRLRVSYDRSIGPAVLWSPFFLAARGLTLVLSGFGVSIATDGFSYLEEASVCIGSIFYAVLGLYVLASVLSRYVSTRTALASVVILFMSTFAFYYALFEPSMGHSLEVFTVSLFVWSVLGRENVSLRAWMFVGAAGGLMVLVRWQNSVFLLLILYGLMRAGQSYGRMMIRAVVVGIAGLMVSAIQCLFWFVVFGKAVTIPQGGSFMTPFNPHFVEVLFSTRHGLIAWHPVFAVAAVGMLFVRPWAMAMTLSSLVLAQLYVCSIVSEWWCADAFGMRRMSGTIPMLAFGMASLLDRAFVSGGARRFVLTFTVTALVVWNALFMAQYRLGMISAGAALTLSEMTTEKLKVFGKGYECLKKIVESRAVKPAGGRRRN